MFKQVVLVLGLVFMANNVFALGLDDIKGHWCDRNDDFTSFLVINEEGRFHEVVQSAETGDFHRDSMGYISLGASSLVMQATSGTSTGDMGLTDIDMELNARRLLKSRKHNLVLYRSGYKVVYEPCIFSIYSRYKSVN